MEAALKDFDTAQTLNPDDHLAKENYDLVEAAINELKEALKKKHLLLKKILNPTVHPQKIINLNNLKKIQTLLIIQIHKIKKIKQQKTNIAKIVHHLKIQQDPKKVKKMILLVKIKKAQVHPLIKKPSLCLIKKALKMILIKKKHLMILPLKKP